MDLNNILNTHMQQRIDQPEKFHKQEETFRALNYIESKSETIYGAGTEEEAQSILRDLAQSGMEAVEKDQVDHWIKEMDLKYPNS
jgi:hypothetical protein